MQRAPSSVSLALLLLAACGGSGGGTGLDPNCMDEQSLEVGTGRNEFSPLVEGQTLEIERGAQGCCHIWVAVRARGLDPQRVTIESDLDPVGGGDQISHVKYRVALPCQGCLCDFPGITQFIDDPAAVDGQRLRIRTTATDNDGVSASATREVIVVAPPP